MSRRHHRPSLIARFFNGVEKMLPARARPAWMRFYVWLSWNRGLLGYIILALAVAYSVGMIFNLAQENRQTSYERAVAIRASQVDACNKSNARVAQINQRFADQYALYQEIAKATTNPKVREALENSIQAFQRIETQNCEQVYPPIRVPEGVDPISNEDAKEQVTKREEPQP